MTTTIPSSETGARDGRRRWGRGEAEKSASLKAKPARDTATVFAREIRPLLRDPFSLVFSLVQPLVFLGLFGPLLVATSGMPAAETLTWFVPGVLVMTVLFGSGMTGSNLLYEMQTGSHERTLVAPIARSALIVGRALKEIAPILVQALIVTLVTIPFGFRADPLGLAAGLILLSVFGVGLGALSYCLALVSRNKDWVFWAVQQSTIFPLLILSGLMLPLDAAPAWMRAAAAVNPVSHIATAERLLVAGRFGEAEVLWGALAAIGIAVVGLAIGIRGVRSLR